MQKLENMLAQPRQGCSSLFQDNLTSERINRWTPCNRQTLHPSLFPRDICKQMSKGGKRERRPRRDGLMEPIVLPLNFTDVNKTFLEPVYMYNKIMWTGLPRTDITQCRLLSVISRQGLTASVLLPVDIPF